MRVILLLLLASLAGAATAQESEALRPLQSFPLHDDLHESSGLVYWDGSLWTHNDSKDNALYQVDPASGEITGWYQLGAMENTDWEDLAQDADYFYMGDFGNNSGNRKDLHILRIKKSSLNNRRPGIDKISFRFGDQEDFSSRPQANDFDCEAMIVRGGQILLFTKQWISAGTSVYILPATPGEHVARKVGAYQVDGLITGADISDDGNTIMLCGYSALIQPFIYLLSDPGGNGFKDRDFFGGELEKIPLALPYQQVEGIAIKNDRAFYLSNEYLRLGSIIEVPQQLHYFSGW